MLKKFWLSLLVTKAFDPTDISPQQNLPFLLVTELFDPTDTFPQDKLRFSMSFSLPHTTLVTAR
jgi:hypothetical protein